MKSLTTVIITFALLLGSTAAHAKCKYQADTVNVTTGEKVLWTRWEGLKTTSKNGGPTFRGAAAAEGDNRYLVLKFQVFGQSAHRPRKHELEYQVGVGSNDMLMIRLANGDTLQLPAAEGAYGDTDFSVPNAAHESPIFADHSRIYKLSTSTVANYILNADDIAKLVANKVTDVRIQIIGGDISFNFKRGTKDIRKLMECLP